MTSNPISDSGEEPLSSAALMWLITKDQSKGRLEAVSLTRLVSSLSTLLAELQYCAVGQMRFMTNLVVSRNLLLHLVFLYSPHEK